MINVELNSQIIDYMINFAKQSDNDDTISERFIMDAETKKNIEEISVDPFYSEGNMTYLKRVIQDIDSGKAVMIEHELLED